MALEVMARDVAREAERALRERAELERRCAGNWESEERHREFIAVLESGTAHVLSDNEVVCQVVDTQHGVTWAYIAEDALHKAADVCGIDAEIIHNGPVQYLLAW